MRRVEEIGRERKIRGGGEGRKEKDGHFPYCGGLALCQTRWPFVWRQLPL